VIRPRVLHCLWDGETGGAERAVYQLVRGQVDNGVVAPAIAFAQGHGPYWDAATKLDCPVLSLGLSSGHSFSAVPHTARELSPYPIHHFHSAEPLLMSASLACRGARRVYTHRGGMIDYSRRKKAQYAIAGLALRTGFHAFSGNTKHAAACASQLFRIDQRRFQVTYNGLDFELLEPRRDQLEVRQELGLAQSDFVLGTAAQLRSWKRIDRLLRLLSVLGVDQVRLLILGDGPDRERLERLASDLGVERQVIFAGTKLRVADYLQCMQAFCLPSMGLESFGNAAVEAMAVGVATVVFADGGGLPEHIDSGRTGFTVANEKELVSVVRTLCDDAELRARIAVQGQEAIRARYTIAAAIKAYDRLYASASAIGPGPTPREPTGHRA
jgi:glycosyltransferase involved in cell wall biosynthesis